MNKARITFVVSFGVVVAAACGGSSTGRAKADGGQSGSSSGSSASSSGGPNPDAAPSIPPNAIPCGGAGNFCYPPLMCCTGPAMDDGGGVSYGCGIQCTTSTTTTMPCTNTADCPSGQACCRIMTGSAMTNSCLASCPGATQICTSTSDCPSGQACTSVGPSGMMTCRCMPGTCGSRQVCCSGSPACQTGSCPTGSFPLCSSAADCRAPQTCMPPRGVGVPMLCQTPPCTGGSCGSGQICCTAGGLGGAGGPYQCHLETRCPVGTYQVCGSSADCSSGDLCGVVARDGDGGTTMYCFPGVADAGAGGD
jgi:hypothetical protein